MTSYRGKLTERRILDRANADRLDDHHLLCCWEDCDRYGTDLHKAREYLGTDPRTGLPVWTWYVFCTDRHKQYWVHSTRELYSLPPGYRLAVI